MNILIFRGSLKYKMHPSEQIPESKTKLDAFDLMRARHSCRSFQSRNLTKKHHEELMKTVKFHSKPKQLLGKNPIRFEYVPASLIIWPVVGAHEFLVAIAPREYNRLSIIDIGRSLQKVVLHVTRMGLATCWIGPGADQGSIIKHLGGKFNPKKDQVICVCAIGYESMYKPLLIRIVKMIQHTRLPLHKLFFANRFCSTALATNLAPFNEYGRCYEVCQWSPSSYNGQTTRCALVTNKITNKIGVKEKIIRFDFLTATASRYYAPVALGIWCANWESGCAALKKHGHFTSLSPKDCGYEDNSKLPYYNISWVAD